MAVNLANPKTWPFKMVRPLVKPDGSMFPPLGLRLAGEGPVVFEAMLSESIPERRACCGRDSYHGFDELSWCWRMD